ncbi:TonB-dependent receptor [Chitinophaga sp. YIM B06452]|uniref:TonB-dependent receptor n=1 Tax=Chitinophaga sp. YIM B06452 TaxID=3082158 RepID=UPI0031FEE86A
MKLIVLLMTTALLEVHAAGFAQTVSISARSTSLEKVFKEIRKQTGYTFLYTDEQLFHARAFSLELKDVPLRQALDQCFENQPLHYTIENKTIVVKRKPAANNTVAPADVVVKGKVTDDKGQPLPGVTIQVKGTARGVTTNANGEYSIEVPGPDAVLIVSSIGYDRREVPVGGNTELNIDLKVSASRITELVVVGYGEQKRGSLTSAISSLTAKDFEAQPVNRIDQVLQGRVTGVQVTNSAGSPGGAVRIRIRGANSINGDNGPIYVVDGFVGAELFSINPDDIESIQVLKDAAATAIYGSRGSNGVILVTTKKGSKGGLKVNFTTRLSTSQVIKKMDLLNAEEFATTVNERATALGTAKPFTDEQIDGFRKNGGTNWQDEIFRNALGQEYQLSLSNGNDKSGYFISGDYLNQDGVINNSSYRRYTLRSNINSKLTNKVSTFLNITGSYSTAQNVDIPADGPHSPLAQAATWSPTVPVRKADGTYTTTDPVGSVFFNPVALTTEQISARERMLANAIGGFKFDDIALPGLSLSLQYGANYLEYQDKSFAGKVINSGTATASLRTNKEIKLQSTNMLNYRRTFNDHSIDATAVLEYQQIVYSYMSAGASNLTYESFHWNNLTQGTAGSPGSGYSKSSIFSLVGRVNYGYKDRYLLSAAVRRDGSSKFLGGNKYSYFPSFSAGWIISQEPFMKDQELFSNLKLRGSWGFTGNDGVGPYSTFSAYSNRNASFTNSTFQNGLILGVIGNPDLKWETTEQQNAGIDASLLNGRVNISADYFVKNTRDLLLNENLPIYLGGNVITRNVGSVQNKGWEFSVEGDVVNRGAVTWNTAVNVSFVKNNVRSTGSKSIIFDPNNRKIGGGMSPQSEFVVMAGQPLGAIWGLQYLGTWKPGEEAAAAKFGAKPGDSRYLDLKEDGVIDAGDYAVIGTGIPRTSLGWTNTINYKTFSLNIFFQGMFGFDKLNYNNAAAMYLGGDARQATLRDILDRYIPGKNETSDIPAFSSTNKNFTQSTRFLEKADFLRLKNVSLSYTLPRPILRHVGLKVFVSATNILTFTDYSGIDPEASSSSGDFRQGIDYGSYPNAKTITGGLTLNF